MTPALERLALPTGGFAMVALDQRESLRTIVAERTGRRPSDDELRAFKVAAARTLTPRASGILLDGTFGLDPVLAAGAIDARCGLIVAADRLDQVPGGSVEDTDLDPGLEPGRLASRGAVALKLLVIWRPRRKAACVDLARRFVTLAHAAGLAAIVEGIVRTESAADREPQIVAAARALGSVGTDLYKAEVPFHGESRPAVIQDWSHAITAAVPCPWVVLSNGVAMDRFPAAVEAACRGGASGFLAGRAVWTDAIRVDEPLEPALTSRALPRLVALRELVERVVGTSRTDAVRA